MQFFFLRYELLSSFFGQLRTNRQKATHMSPACKVHRWAEKKSWFISSEKILLLRGKMHWRKDKSLAQWPKIEIYPLHRRSLPTGWLNCETCSMSRQILAHNNMWSDRQVQSQCFVHPATTAGTSFWVLLLSLSGRGSANCCQTMRPSISDCACGCIYQN